VHHHYFYREAASIAAPADGDLVSLVVDDVRGEYMLFSGFGANLDGTSVGTHTYTASGDPQTCPPPPMNTVIPGAFQPTWTCGGLGRITPGSNRIHEDTTVHDQTNPPGTTHYRYDFMRQ
jgi:hypothetical protein